MNQDYRKDPVNEEVAKNVGSFSLIVKVEKDLDMINEFKHIKNFIAFKTTLKNENNEVIGIGTGTGVINRLNKYLERTVRFTYNASLIDAMVKSIKILDALYITPTNQKETSTPIEEDSDKQAFYGDEDMPQFATEKQRNFAQKLIEKCDEDEKEDYMKQLESPYLSKFQCSELIQKLMPVK